MLNLSWAAQQRSGLDIQFANAGVVDSRITFSRTSNATMFDATGKLTYGPNNLMSYSATPSGAGWSATGAGVAGNVITQDGSTGNHGVSNGGKIFATNNWLTAIKVSAGTTTRVAIAFGVAYGSTNVVFNLATGTVAATANAFGWPIFSSGIIDQGGGVYLCYVRLGTGGSAFNGSVAVFAADASNSISFTGDGAGTFTLYNTYFSATTYETTPRAGDLVDTAASAYYGPRLTYDPATLSALGLMIEEARTNLQFYSGALTNSTTGWDAINCTVAANGGAGPDGTTAMTRITSTLAGNRVNSKGTGMAVSGSSTYTGSFYMRAGSSNFAGIVAGGVGGAPTSCGAIFTLTGAGTVVSTAGTGSPSATIKLLTTGLYRCTLTFTTGVGQTSVQFGAGVSDGTTYASTIYPSAASGTIDADCAQLELGPNATSYIPTTTAGVTRAADNAAMTGVSFSSWFNVTTGTFIVEGARSTNASFSAHVSVNDGGTSNEMYLCSNVNGFGGTAPFGSISVSGVAASNASGSLALGTTGKFALAYGATNAVAGAGAAEAAIVSSIPTVTRMEIGARGGVTTQLNGTIKRLRYFPRRLSSAEMQDLTT